VHPLQIRERLPRLRATSPRPRWRLSSRNFLRRSYLTTCRTQSWAPPHLTNKPSVLFDLGRHRMECRPRRGPPLPFVAASLRRVPVLPCMREVVKPRRRACMMTAVPRPATREGLESTRHRGRPQRFHPARRLSSDVLAARSLGAAFRSQAPLCFCVAS
jgi:hypothetical protein